MAAKIVLVAALATFLGWNTLAADLQKFRDNFVNIDRMYEDNNNVHLEGVHGVPTNIYAVGMCNPTIAQIMNLTIILPTQPRKRTIPQCLPFGAVGLAINSVAIYHPLAGGNVNAVEGATTEGFDICGGHASPDSMYHYHKIPERNPSLLEAQQNSHAPHKHLCPYTEGEVDKIIGVGFDGFMLYGPKVTIGGKIFDFRYTNNAMNGSVVALDECHGTDIDAENGYAYIANLVYPYMLGCYRGEVQPTASSRFQGSSQECLTIKQGELCDCCQGLLTRDDTTDEDEDPCPYTCVYDDDGVFGTLPPPTQDIVSNQGNQQQNNAGNQGNGQNSNRNNRRKTEPFGPWAGMMRQSGQQRNSLLDLLQPRRGNMNNMNNLNNPFRNPSWYSFNRQTVEQNMAPFQDAVSGTFIPTGGDNDGGMTLDDDDDDNEDNNNGDGDGNIDAVIPDRCLIPPGGGGGGPPKNGPPKGGDGGPPPPKKDQNCPYVGTRPIARRRKRDILENLVKKLAMFK